MSVKKQQPTKCPAWNPYSTFTWTTKEFQAWVDETGGSPFWDGKMWEPVARLIAPGRYKIRFTEASKI